MGDSFVVSSDLFTSQFTPELLSCITMYKHRRKMLKGKYVDYAVIHLMPKTTRIFPLYPFLSFYISSFRVVRLFACVLQTDSG